MCPRTCYLVIYRNGLWEAGLNPGTLRANACAGQNGRLNPGTLRADMPVWGATADLCPRNCYLVIYIYI